MSHACQVIFQPDIEGTVTTISRLDDNSLLENPRTLDEKTETLCGRPAPHENPQYLEDFGIYNYVHWLCDGHWDRLLEIQQEDAAEAV